jgi:hypothetical protein
LNYVILVEGNLELYESVVSQAPNCVTEPRVAREIGPLGEGSVNVSDLVLRSYCTVDFGTEIIGHAVYVKVGFEILAYGASHRFFVLNRSTGGKKAFGLSAPARNFDSSSRCKRHGLELIGQLPA